jgi:predicted nucleic acid-binding protein
VLVLLDANVWLAALAGGGFCRRVLEASASTCTFVTTPLLLDEVKEKLERKFNRTSDQAKDLVNQIAARSWHREDVAFEPLGFDDPDDEPILVASAAYACDILVTGEKKLLALGSFRGVEILSVRSFAEKLRLQIE